MLLEAQHLIFIHVPKTAGNFLQTRMSAVWGASPRLIPHARGFELRDDFTESKHQRLSKYQQKLGAQVEEFAVVAIWRDPVERMVSFYFSPHRQKGRSFRPWPKPFDFDLFAQLVSKQRSTSDLLRLVTTPHPASLQLLPFRTLTASWVGLENSLGISARKFDRPINRSRRPGFARRLARQPRVRSIVLDSHHVEDYLLDPAVENFPQGILWKTGLPR